MRTMDSTGRFFDIQMICGYRPEAFFSLPGLPGKGDADLIRAEVSQDVSRFSCLVGRRTSFGLI